ncbi:UDP-N-acetylmuramate dehydrogenase [Candidatus Daviesbacteria bacterium]|nr:UDP-N-acetylmuramate dehydrogenase [Candidatus Daviesbacteria bacterium]
MQIEENVALNKVTTLAIGGPAKGFVTVSNIDQLKEALLHSFDYGLEFLVIGGGSNILVSDEGFNGLIIKNQISGIEQNGDTLKVKSGTSLQDLVNFSIEKDLGGLHKLNGIPGTVGGAIFGNAGAFGQTISDYLQSVTTLNPKDQSLMVLSKDECQFEYRDSGFKRNGLIILEVELKLPNQDQELLKKEAQEVLEKRLKKYPPGILCPGSFFKNLFINKLPEGVQKQIPKERDYFGKVPAWFFLDEVGAKGDQLGQIKIADFHGNLFINLGEGNAKDFYELAKKYFIKVKEKFGVELEPEVQFINLPPLSQ